MIFTETKRSADQLTREMSVDVLKFVVAMKKVLDFFVRFETSGVGYIV